MWNFLHERGNGTSTFSKGSVHTTLAPMKYTGQPMHEYVVKWKMRTVQLASMDALTDNGILEFMVTESLTDSSEMRYKAILFLVLTKEDLASEALL